MKFVSYPSSKAWNPVISILNNGLKEFGYEEAAPNVWIDIISSWNNRKSIKIIWLHWPESFWRNHYIFISVLKASLFVLRYYWLKVLGFKIVWSAHNIMPNYLKFKRIEWLMRLFLLKNADLVIGHALSALEELKTAFGKEPANFICSPLAMYEKLPLNKIASRKELNLPQGIILTLKTRNLDYDGGESFIHRFVQINPKNVLLIVVGDGTEKIKKVINSQVNIKYYEGFIEDTLFHNLIAISDYVVLPYKKITTSSMFFMAMTYDVPVIAPDLPFFKRHSNDGFALLYDSNDNDPWTKVLLSDVIKFKKSIKAIEELKSQFSWQKSCKIIAEAFDKL